MFKLITIEGIRYAPETYEEPKKPHTWEQEIAQLRKRAQTTYAQISKCETLTKAILGDGDLGLIAQEIWNAAHDTTISRNIIIEAEVQEVALLKKELEALRQDLKHQDKPIETLIPYVASRLDAMISKCIQKITSLGHKNTLHDGDKSIQDSMMSEMTTQVKQTHAARLEQARATQQDGPSLG